MTTQIHLPNLARSPIQMRPLQAHHLAHHFLRQLLRPPPRPRRSFSPPAHPVALTLIALIVKIRQSRKSQEALVVDALAAASKSNNVAEMEWADLGSARAKATADSRSADREQRILEHYFRFALSKLLDDALYQ